MGRSSTSITPLVIHQLVVLFFRLFFCFKTFTKPGDLIMIVFVLRRLLDFFGFFFKVATVKKVSRRLWPIWADIRMFPHPRIRCQATANRRPVISKSPLPRNPSRKVNQRHLWSRVCCKINRASPDIRWARSDRNSSPPWPNIGKRRGAVGRPRWVIMHRPPTTRLMRQQVRALDVF